MDSDDARELLAEFALGELEGDAAKDVEAAVGDDPALQKALAQYKAMDTLFHAYAEATHCEDAEDQVQKLPPARRATARACRRAWG